MGNNRPSQAKRRKIKERRQKLAQKSKIELQQLGRIESNTYQKLLENFNKIPSELKKDLFKHSLCDNCLNNLPKFKCSKCFSKNIKIKKIVIPVEKCKETLKSSGNSLSSLKERLIKIRNTFCERHTPNGQPADLCVDCLQIQYNLTDQLSLKYK